jgi:hypothetical protein
MSAYLSLLPIVGDILNLTSAAILLAATIRRKNPRQ